MYFPIIYVHFPIFPEMVKINMYINENKFFINNFNANVKSKIVDALILLYHYQLQNTFNKTYSETYLSELNPLLFN